MAEVTTCAECGTRFDTSGLDSDLEITCTNCGAALQPDGDAPQGEGGPSHAPGPRRRRTRGPRSRRRQELDKAGERGRVFVTIAIVVLAVLEMISQVLGGIDLVTLIFRGGLTALLLVFLWLGHRWARWVIVTLCGLAAILVVVIALGKTLPLFLALSVPYLVIVALLLMPGVKEFQTYQRAKG
jgi:hypothetical protein